MADGTKIEWADASWNPVRGCTRVSPGCGGPNHQGGCYAEKVAARFSDPGQPYHGFAERTAHGGRWTGKVALIESMLDTPLRWRKPRRIFVNSMSDWAHENLSFADMARIVAVTLDAPHHTYLLLTKRAARQREFARWWCMQHAESCLPSCLWLGVSVEDQARADERIPLLLDTPAAKRFISAEPLLGPIDLQRLALPADWPRCDCERHSPTFDAFTGSIYCEGCCEGPEATTCPGLDWVIVGGESGAGARPMHPDWPRAIRDQCEAAGVPFFFKQWGEWGCDTGPQTQGHDAIFEGRARCAWWHHASSSWRYAENGFVVSLDEARGSGDWVYRLGKSRGGRLLDGVEHNEVPAWLTSSV